MAGDRPDQEWWTSTELAASGLLDVPATQQGVEAMLKKEGWRGTSHARRRAGRGGGWEYHWTLLPVRARRKLLQDTAPAVPEKPGRDEAWAWFDGLPATTQDVARRRLHVLQLVEGMVASGLTKFDAVIQAEVAENVPMRTIWRWFSAVEGVRADDRLPFLAPRHRAAPKRLARVHVEPAFMDLIKSDYLRPAGPSFTSVYRRACRVAEKQGIATVPERTAIRRYKAEVSKLTEVLCRKGADALKTYYPSQTRDKTALAPLEVVNADTHRFDVFVQWPMERGETELPKPARPQMMAFQDVFSGYILSWRVDLTPNRVAVALAAGDMIENFGIPEHVLFDNGRENAAKAITGGAQNRFRFKVKDTDPQGLFVALGCTIHWATPYSGQSKPIERAFRDMCDNIAKDPRFDGAYTGNTPLAKPEDYQSRAVPLDQFLEVLAEGIEEHNNRVGRRSEVAMGRSFAEVFNEAYAVSPIRKATEEQRRLWLLGAEGLNAKAKTGLIKFEGNEYWAPWMNAIAGEPVIVRFDPEDFHAGLHVYSAENAYLGHAPCKVKVGFLDTEEARAHSKARQQYIKALKVAAAAHRKLRAVELGRMLDDAAPPPSSPVEAKVVRPVFADQRARPVAPMPSPEVVAAQAAVQAEIVDIMQRLPMEAVEEAIDRYQRARQLEAAQARGDELTRDQRRWLGTYQTTAEYAAHADQWAIFGDRMFG